MSDARMLESGELLVEDGTYRKLEGVPSAFNPLTSIPWTAAMWADDPAQTKPSNGATVSTWNQPGSYTFNEWTANSTPTFVASWTNGHPAIDFSGGTTRLWCEFAAANTLNVTVAIVGAAMTTEADLCDDYYQPGGVERMLLDRSAGQWRMYRGALPAGGTPDANPHLFIARYNNDTADFLKIDGAIVLGPTSTGSYQNHSIAIGASPNNTDHVQSRIAFCGLITRDLTTTEQSDLLTWSRSYYATP